MDSSKLGFGIRGKGWPFKTAAIAWLSVLCYGEGNQLWTERQSGEAIRECSFLPLGCLGNRP